MKSSLDRRRDKRTPEQFKSDISFHTAKEARLMKRWAEYVRSCGADCNYSPLAKGRNGEFLEKSSGDADFNFNVCGWNMMNDGEYKLEVKYSPCLWKATFKVAEMKAYISQEAHMLLILGEGTEDPRLWTVLNTDQLRCIINEHEVRTDYRGMGGKPAVLVMKHTFERYFGQLYEWD